jgi:hypothetical protein
METDWHEVAKNYLRNEEISLSRQEPRGVAAFIQWRNNSYVGSVQKIAPEYSDEIVLLSKTSRPIPKQLKEAIAELDQNRLELWAETMIDLEGQYHVLRMVGDRLKQMTADQMQYMRKRGLTVAEENTGEVTKRSGSHYFINPEDVGLSEN